MLNEPDKSIIKNSNSNYLFKHLLDALNNATSHQVAFNSFYQIQLSLLINSRSAEAFTSLNWSGALSRFASILPKSSTDQLLFTKIFSTIAKIFQNCRLDNQVASEELDTWLSKTINDEQSSFCIVLIKLLNNFESDYFESIQVFVICVLKKSRSRQ